MKPAIDLPFTPNSDEWLAHRQTGVGASDIPIILGLSSFMEPRELFHVKRGEIEPRPMQQWQRFGHLLEPAVVAAFTEDTGIAVKRYPAPVRARADNPRHMATPDADLVPDGEGLECKHASRFSTVWEHPFDRVPDPYYVQAQWQMHVCDWERVWIELLVDGSQTHTLFVDRDAAVIRELIGAADLFLEAVDSGDAPDWTDQPELDVVRRRYTEFTGEVVTLPADIVDAWETMQELTKRANATKKEADRLKAQVLEAMGNADAAELPGGGFIRRKLQKRAAHMVKESEFIMVRQVKKL